MEFYKLFAIGAVFLFLFGCVSAPEEKIVPSKENVLPADENAAKESPLVGGDRDAHGCIGSAGYSWCEQKQKCLRIWEEGCE